MKMLIAIDEGPFCSKIAMMGFQIGRQMKSEIGLLSVVDNTFNVSEGFVSARNLTNVVEKEFRNVHRMLIEEIFKDDTVKTFIEEGKPLEKILSVADHWNADVIVIGTRSRYGSTASVMGSVASDLLRYSTRPCFVIPPGYWDHQFFESND